MIRLYTDAGLNTNLNLAAIAYVIRKNDKTTTFVKQVQATDNHYLEFLALKNALDKIIEMKLSDILFIHSDSKILTDSIDKKYSKNYQEILDIILEQLEHFPSYFVKHIADKDNGFAHSLVHQELLKIRHS